MVLLLDQAHAAFIRKARAKTRRRVGLSSRRHATPFTAALNQLSSTSLAPTRDNATPGKYFCVFEGQKFPREEQLRLEAQDLAEGNVDSHGNPPCGNETFADLTHFAPGVDFDLESDYADGPFLERYAKFLLDVLSDMADGPLPDATQVVITTITRPGAPGVVEPYAEDRLECPFCKGDVVQASLVRHTHGVSASAARSAGAGDPFVTPHPGGGRGTSVLDDDDDDAPAPPSSRRKTGSKKKTQKQKQKKTPSLEYGYNGMCTHVCCTCASKWSHEDDDGEPYVLQVRGKHARMKDTDDTQPRMTSIRKVGCHFRIQGVLMEQADLLALLHAVRKRSYAFDRNITPAVWDKTVDMGPAEKCMMRKVLHNKATVCKECKGSRVVTNDFGDRLTCVACMGSGRIIKDKRYRIFNVLYKDGTLLTERAAADHSKYAHVLHRHYTNVPFIVKLCSMAVPIEGARVVGLRDDALATVPADLPSKTPTGNIRSGPTRQQHNWIKQRKKAFKFVDPRFYKLLFRIITRHQPRYKEHCTVLEAFYTQVSCKKMLVHICGDGATFCQNRLKHDIAVWKKEHEGQAPSDEEKAKMGYHTANHAWMTVAQKGVTFHCWTSNPNSGCDKWRGSKPMPITGAEASALFSHHTDDEAVIEAHGTCPYEKEHTFLNTFHSKQQQRAFMDKVVQAVNLQNKSVKYCALRDNVCLQTVDTVLKFHQANGFKYCPPEKRELPLDEQAQRARRAKRKWSEGRTMLCRHGLNAQAHRFTVKKRIHRHRARAKRARAEPVACV